MTRKPARTVLAVVAVAASLAACSQQPRLDAHQQHGAPAAAEQQQQVAGQFGPTEKAFVEEAVAINAQSLKLLGHGPHAANPELRSLAADVQAARRSELLELEKLAGVALVPTHEHTHDMPGMPPDDEIATIMDKGAGFDAEFSRLLRAHLAESAVETRNLLAESTHEPTRELAGRMEQSRTAALQRLDALAG